MTTGDVSVKEIGLSPEYQLLCWLVCATSDEVAANAISQLLSSTQIDWEKFVDEAELNAVAPLLYYNRDNTRVKFNTVVLNKLRALAVRHRHASEIYTKALIELLTSFDERGIEIILLKGAALARTVYPDPGLRPMRDLDILVHADDLLEAKSTCQLLGFDEDINLGSESIFVTHRHHLPSLERCKDGLLVSLEIHQDAFSRDTFVHLNMANLTSKTQTFQLSEGLQASMLGPVDMLDHLTQHAFEPGTRLKLIQAVDLSLYLLAYQNNIPWPLIQHRYPKIINRLQLIHSVCPLPEEMLGLLDNDWTHSRCDRGILMPALSHLLYRGMQIDKVLGELFRPPVWWLYGYYGRSEKTPLLYLLLVIHPWRISRWLFRRVWIAIISIRWLYGNPA